MSDCENCPVHNTGNLIKLGINMSKFDYLVALAGNPNTGKSTVFNNLTGLKQHTGNWPGKTVTRAEGGYSFNEKQYKLVDLPGTYSLLSTSEDEEVARNFVLFGQPDVTVIVVDATRLERNLNLVLQILEITNRAVLCLNLMDEAKRYKYKIDIRALSKDLGIPVIPTEARQRKGMTELLQAIHEVATGEFKCKPHQVYSIPSNVKKIISGLIEKIETEFPNLPNSKWVAMRLLEGDQQILDSIRNGDLNSIVKSSESEVVADGELV